MKSAPAIVFDYRPSRLLQCVLIGVGVLAMLAALASGVPSWAKALLGIAALGGAARALRRLRNPVVRRCAWHASGHWRVRDAGGQDHPASLLQASVRGALIVLRLRSPLQGSSALVLLPDNCDSETRRRLRVRLTGIGPALGDE